MGVTSLSLADVSELVRCKKLSPVELTQACLARIEHVDPRLNAFITVMAESALAEARVAEAEISRGEWRGPMHGIPIALKDIIETAGVRTAAASALRKDYVPTKDAEVVRRLRAAGAVFIGKTNMHEFAYGGSSAISHFGPVHNPWDVERSPGGSSGGSAAAVAAEMCFAAIGTDTGGSIRQPAAYCGIVGLKPTYGYVSTQGVMPLSWAFDHVGPMTRTVKDAALMLAAIADDADHTASLGASTAAMRVGILSDLFFENIHPEIAAAMEEALRVLKKLTREQRDVPPLVGDATYESVMKPYRTVITAEAYEYHKKDVERTPELYQPATLKRIRAGASVTREEYEAGKHEMERIRAKAGEVFRSMDVMITPTAAVPPYRIDELIDVESARSKELEMLRNTRPINMFGLPAISVPCGSTRDGLPIGMQIISAPGADVKVLQLAYAYERETECHKRKPSLRK